VNYLVFVQQINTQQAVRVLEASKKVVHTTFKDFNKIYLTKFRSIKLGFLYTDLYIIKFS